MAVCHNYGRPNNTMERYVIFPNKVIAFCIFILPKIQPSARVVGLPSPFYRGGQVADYRFEPDIDALVFISFHWDRNTPIQIPRYCSVLQSALQKAPTRVQNVSTPMRLVFHPVEQIVLEGRQFQEEVLGLPELRSSRA